MEERGRPLTNDESLSDIARMITILTCVRRVQEKGIEIRIFFCTFRDAEIIVLNIV